MKIKAIQLKVQTSINIGKSIKNHEAEMKESKYGIMVITKHKSVLVPWNNVVAVEYED